jgi:hypothetical protein
MPNTPRGYPYPADSDRPDVPLAVRNLATEIDDGLRRCVSGSMSLPLSGANTAAGNAILPDEWKGRTFDVSAVAVHSSGNYVACVTHIETTESGGLGTFRVRVNHLTGANATTTVAVRWIAVER